MTQVAGSPQAPDESKSDQQAKEPATLNGAAAAPAPDSVDASLREAIRPGSAAFTTALAFGAVGFAIGDVPLAALGAALGAIVGWASWQGRPRA